MFKSFKLYVEEKELEDRSMRTMLLQRLGFEPKAMDDSTIKLRDLSKDRLKQAVGSLGLDQETVQSLHNWIENNPDTTLQNLMAQVSGVSDGQMNNDEFGQQDVPEAPAELPQGQPKPPRKPVGTDKDIGTSMYGGGPPVDGRMT